MSFSLVPLVVSLALSDLSGLWIGKGRIEDLQGKWGSECEVALRIEAAEDRLLLREGHYACDGFSMEWQPLKFANRQGRLYFQDTEVGALQSEGFRFDLRGPDGTYWSADFSAADAEAVWKDEMGEPGDGIRSRFELKRSSGTR